MGLFFSRVMDSFDLQVNHPILFFPPKRHTCSRNILGRKNSFETQFALFAIRPSISLVLVEDREIYFRPHGSIFQPLVAGKICSLLLSTVLLPFNGENFGPHMQCNKLLFKSKTVPKKSLHIFLNFSFNDSNSIHSRDSQVREMPLGNTVFPLSLISSISLK